ncbi:MAG: fibronectin type III domain-containing protein [bacterium]
MGPYLKDFKFHPGVLIIVLILLSQCGLKAPPVPYPLAKPVAITNLTAIARYDSIMLLWSVPLKNTDGSNLKDIKGFNVIRAGIPITMIGTGEKEIYKQWRYDYKPKEQYMTIYDKEIHYGFRYTYLVFTITQNDIVSEPSNQVIVYWDKPFMPPTDVRGEPGSHFVELTWEKPTKYIDGTGIDKTVYFNIYRSTKMDNFPLFPINPILISGTTYIDGDLKNNEPYFYEITSVSDVDGTPVESMPSSEIMVMPVDLVSPARPYGLSAAPLANGVALSWEPNTESDILGYYVYRKSNNDKTFKLLNAQPVSGTTYIDKTAHNGYNIYYVTAVDNSTQHNESAPSETYKILYRRRR